MVRQAFKKDKPVLLVVDDEAGHRQMIRAVMAEEGYEVLEAENGQKCLEFLGRRNPDVLLLDMKMPVMGGMAVLEELNSRKDSPPVIMLTAFGSVGSAVEAMKAGAYDYLTKPADIEELKAVIDSALEYGQMTRTAGDDQKPLSRQKMANRIIGQSRAMQEVLDLVQQMAPSEGNVLILGESGTGKELIARALHEGSGRAGGPLIKVNCAALPEDLLESELFGYRKGAFTGAVKDKPGRFQLAQGGTLFLDEMGEMPLHLQAKLLRALQERVVEPLGSVGEEKIDIRLITATNKDLAQEVEKGNFRQDLYFRLNVLEVTVPPLRERLEDIPLLVKHFIQVLGDKNRKPVRGADDSFLKALKSYDWPGNVRELENIIERAIILCRSDVLTRSDLPPMLARPSRSRDEGQKQGNSSMDDYVEQAEKEALVNALQAHQGHREKTAQSLGISRRSLQYKLKKYGLIRPYSDS